MTSNMGSTILQEKFEEYEDPDTVTEASRPMVMELLRKAIRPEFLNRIDDILMFTPLNRKAILKIVQLQLNQLKKVLEKQHIILDATDEAIAYLGEKGYDPQYGARPIKRLLQREVLNVLSKELLAGKIQANNIVLLDSFEDKLVFRNQKELVQ